MFVGLEKKLLFGFIVEDFVHVSNMPFKVLKWESADLY